MVLVLSLLKCLLLHVQILWEDPYYFTEVIRWHDTSKQTTSIDKQHRKTVCCALLLQGIYRIDIHLNSVWTASIIQVGIHVHVALLINKYCLKTTLLTGIHYRSWLHALAAGSTASSAMSWHVPTRVLWRCEAICF